MTSHDIKLSLIPIMLRLLINVSVLSTSLINSILRHFKINADISILDKSVMLGLPFSVFAGYSVLSYVNDSLTC